jgi:hypothetical protein
MLLFSKGNEVTASRLKRQTASDYKWGSQHFKTESLIRPYLFKHSHAQFIKMSWQFITNDTQTGS